MFSRLKKNKRAEEDGEATSEKKRRSVKSEEKMKVKSDALQPLDKNTWL